LFHANSFRGWYGIRDRIQKGFILSRLADISGLSRETLEAELRMHLRNAASTPHTRPENPATARRAASAPQKEAERPAAPAAPLDFVEAELLGHLYSANPGNPTGRTSGTT
jgi:hypothetical protein